MRAGEGDDTEGRGPEGESAFRTVTCLPILPGVDRMSTSTPAPAPAHQIDQKGWDVWTSVDSAF